VRLINPAYNRAGTTGRPIVNSLAARKRPSDREGMTDIAQRTLQTNRNKA